jgi:cytochrome oxidase Cu insertion factor (SCO1/SenC/PrrC family)
MAVVDDPVRGVRALGPESGGRALTTAKAPDLELPDADGNPFNLSAMHGRKVLLVAWASW